MAGAGLYFAGILNSIILEHPERPGAPAVVVGVGAAIGLLVYVLRGAGEGEARTTTRRLWFLRLTWVFVCAMGLVGISWILGMPRQHSYDWTPYHNDAIALNECAARLVLSGRDPYTDLDLFACYNRLAIGPDRTTPLRRGLFANDVVYPTDQEMDDAWDLRSNGVGTNVEFVWRPSYPSLSFLFLLPVVALGIDTNYLYVACLLAAMALVLWRAPSGLRPFFLTALRGAPLLPSIVYAVLEIAALALSIVVAWRARRTSPELGAVLAVLPLFFAWRSLFSYFFLLPLLALAAVSRMPLGDPVADRARRLGGLTIFAAPSRT